MKGGDVMIVVKVILIILAVFFDLWSLWGIGQHFNLVEGEQSYIEPFPIFRIISLVVCIIVFILL